MNKKEEKSESVAGEVKNNFEKVIDTSPLMCADPCIFSISSTKLFLAYGLYCLILTESMWKYYSNVQEKGGIFLKSKKF